MSRTPALLVALMLAPAAALAQDRPVTVFFEPCNDQQLNDAITTALTQPPFVLLTRNMPGALVVAIPDRITVDRGKVSGTSIALSEITDDKEFERIIVMGKKTGLDTTGCPFSLELGDGVLTGSWSKGADKFPVNLHKVAVLDDTKEGKDRKSTRLNSSHFQVSRMPSSA